MKNLRGWLCLLLGAVCMTSGWTQRLLTQPELAPPPRLHLAELLGEVYERGRQWALANPGELAKILATAAKLPDPVAAKQLERTQLVEPVPGEAERQTIIAAGKALQTGGVIKPEIDVVATVDSLFEPSFATSVAAAE